MFNTNNKNFRNDLNTIIEKLKTKEPFAFSKYADGELSVLVNKPINNGEFWFNPETDQSSRENLINSFRYKNESYFVGISCPCCIGGSPVHNWMKKNSGQDEEHLTWANIFVNSNHPYYVENMIPEYKNYEVVVVSNSSSNIDALPFDVKKHFSIGKNAWTEDYSLVQEIKNYIDENDINGNLFLFCAGPFGNILTHQLFEHNSQNTYIDIGSTLNVMLLGEAGKNRSYLRGGASLNKVCVWGT
jgi:hypothetical protein